MTLGGNPPSFLQTEQVNFTSLFESPYQHMAVLPAKESDKAPGFPFCTDPSLSKNTASPRFSFYHTSSWSGHTGLESLQYRSFTEIKIETKVLTYVTILTRPAWEAITVVACDQILTGFGIYTRFGLAFICI